MNVKRILFATDFSAASMPALGLASSLASDASAVLFISHVEVPIPYPGAPGTYGIAIEDPEYQKENEEKKEKLNRIRPTVEGVECVHRFRQGIPAEEILRLSKEEGVDLIVVGCHGRTGLSRLLMGSVAEEIVRKAACPVVVVKTPMQTDDTQTTDR